jgi:hypothetical protein
MPTTRAFVSFLEEWEISIYEGLKKGFSPREKYSALLTYGDAVKIVEFTRWRWGKVLWERNVI